MRHLELYRTTQPTFGHSALWNLFTAGDSSNISDSTDEKTSFSPRANVEETKDSYLIEFDVPGVKREDIKIDVHGRSLSISGERKREMKSESTGLQRYECSTGSFARSFVMPEGVDGTKVEAVLADGVLHVTLPKAEAEKPRSIQIK